MVAILTMTATTCTPLSAMRSRPDWMADCASRALRSHAAGHQQHGRAQVGGDVGVEVVLEGRVLSHEVRAFAQDEVVARLQRFVSAQNFVHEHGGLPFVDQFPGLFQRAGEGVGVGRVQVKARAQKFDVVVRPGSDRGW